MKKALGLLLALAMVAALVCVPMAAVAEETETPLLLWGAETLDGMQTPVNISPSVVTDLEQAEGEGAVRFDFQDSVIADIYKGYTTFKFYEPVDLSNFTTASIDVYIGGKAMTVSGPNIDQCIGINFIGAQNTDNRG